MHENFPTYEEIGKTKDYEFVVKDLSVSLLLKIERNPNLSTPYNILKDATTLTDEQMETLTEAEVGKILEHIYDISNPDKTEVDGEEKGEIERAVAFLIQRGHTFAYTYRVRFFRTAINVMSGKEEKQETNNFDTIKGMFS